MNQPLGEFCPVCGLNQHEEVLRLAGETCGCCGTQYTGYFAKDIVIRLRQRWIDDGYQWSWRYGRPRNWDPSTQMQQIPEAFRIQ